MGVCLRHLGDNANLGELILLLESTDVFMEECAGVLQVVLDGSKPSNKLVLKFGSPHPQQYQPTSVSTSGSYNTVGIFNHFSQDKHATEWIVLDHTQALPQITHGYLTCLGPGLG